jgi:hypothetical protein
MAYTVEDTLKQFNLNDFNKFTLNGEPITLTALLHGHNHEVVSVVRVHAKPKELTLNEIDIIFYKNNNEDLEELQSDFNLPNGSHYIEITLNIILKGEKHGEK